MTIEQWCKEKKTDLWQFLAAKMLKSWAIGQEVSEQEYEKAVYEAANLRVR